MSDQPAEKYVLPFAPHSPFWQKTDKGGCYGVFDCRVTDEFTSEEESKFLAETERSASEFIGVPSEFSGGMRAGDFFCGSVTIIYFSPKGKDEVQHNPS